LYSVCSTFKDLAALISFDGKVVNANSSQPIRDALVSSSLDSQTTLTDVAGHFFLQTRKSGQNVGFYSITVSASGYVTKQIQGFYFVGNHVTGLVVPLTP